MSAEGRGQENMGRGYRRNHDPEPLEREEASFQRPKEHFTKSNVSKKKTWDKGFDTFSLILRK